MTEQVKGSMGRRWFEHTAWRYHQIEPAMMAHKSSGDDNQIGGMAKHPPQTLQNHRRGTHRWTSMQQSAMEVSCPVRHYQVVPSSPVTSGAAEEHFERQGQLPKKLLPGAR